MNVRVVDGADSEYVTEAKLGRGGQGQVFLVKKKSTNKRHACKVINFYKQPHDTDHPKSIAYDEGRRETAVKRIWEELQIMQELKDCDNIVSFTGDCSVDLATGQVRIYLEFYRGGDLGTILDLGEQRRTPIYPTTVLSWALDIARGLSVAHSMNKLHRDIKPGNVLLPYRYDHDDLLQALDKSENTPLTLDLQSKLGKIVQTPGRLIPKCCVSDWGLGLHSQSLLAKEFTHGDFWCGTPVYMPPEVAQDKRKPKFSAASDMYSYGVTIWQLCTLKQIPGNFDFQTIPSCYPSELRSLVTRCLSREPTLRPKAAEIVDGLQPILNGQMQRLMDLISRCRNNQRSNPILPPGGPVPQAAAAAAAAAQVNQSNFSQNRGYQPQPQPNSNSATFVLPQQTQAPQQGRESMMGAGGWLLCFFFCCPIACCLKMCEECSD